MTNVELNGPIIRPATKDEKTIQKFYQMEQATSIIDPKAENDNESSISCSQHSFVSEEKLPTRANSKPNDCYAVIKLSHYKEDSMRKTLSCD